MFFETASIRNELGSMQPDFCMGNGTQIRNAVRSASKGSQLRNIPRLQTNLLGHAFQQVQDSGASDDRSDERPRGEGGVALLMGHGYRQLRIRPV